ncbi:MAG: hypothetical protein HC905_27070 [Bacteroidales bacterium]|nr:hypothetical protein [Bacteroidales bacterium]
MAGEINRIYENLMSIFKLKIDARLIIRRTVLFDFKLQKFTLMQRVQFINEVLTQNKTLERRNEELIKLVEAWQTNSRRNRPRFTRTLDMHEIENLIIGLYQIYKIPISLFDEFGKLLFSIGWKNSCLRFHGTSLKSLSNCGESIGDFSVGLNDSNSYSFKCRNNINAIAIPIFVRKENIGTILINQFFYEDEIPDNTELEKAAYEAGINLNEYMKAIRDLPVLSHNEVSKLTEFYILVAEIISFIASRNLEIQDQHTIENQKNAMCLVFREKLEEQSLLIKALSQFVIQQHQENESLKNEIFFFKEETAQRT